MFSGIFWASQAAGQDLEDRIINLENTAHEYEVYEIINSGTTGTVDLSEHSTIVLDQYEGLADCLILQVDPFSQKPIDSPALSDQGDTITAVLNTDGTWYFNEYNGNAIYPMAIVYQIQLAEVYKATELSNEKIVNESEIPTAHKTVFDNSVANLSALNVQDAIDEIQNFNPGIQFNTLDNTPPVLGQIKYNAGDKVVQIGEMNGSVQDVGREVYRPAINQTGSTILNGTVVMYDGAIGASGKIKVTPAIATVGMNTQLIVGIATHDIPNGEIGLITIEGDIHSVDTSAWAEGDILYVSTTTPGALTNVEPDAPYPAITIASVINVHAVNGHLAVRPSFPQSLAELSDVNGAAIDDRSMLEFNAAEGYWEAKPNFALVDKNDTGFVNPAGIVVTYNAANRTITLTGDVEAYWLGRKVDVLTSGWTSPAHSATTPATYYLYYNGTSFVWSTTPWTFDMMQIALVRYSTNSFALREVHSLMEWRTHKENHEVVGTYLGSGGDIVNYALNSTTAANRRPDISETLINDEDLPTTNPAFSTKLYTQFYLNSTNNGNFTLDAADIIPLSTNQPYYNQFDGVNWVQTLFPVNAYGKIFVIALPATADIGSQKVRFFFVQPQTVSTTLAEIQTLTPSSVNLGTIGSAAAEYVYIGEIIVRYTAGNWQLISVAKLTGSRVSQSSSAAGSFLSAVSSDETIDGVGTASDPLIVKYIKPARSAGTGLAISNLYSALSTKYPFAGGTPSDANRAFLHGFISISGVTGPVISWAWQNSTTIRIHLIINGNSLGFTDIISTTTAATWDIWY